MIGEEHLHTSDLKAFRQQRLSATEHTAATRHLLQCSQCRNRLPLPTTDQFWRRLMDIGESGPEVTKSAAWFSPKDFVSGMFGQLASRNAVFAGILLIAIVGLSGFLMMPESPGVDENAIAVLAGDTERFEYPQRGDESVRDKTANIEVPVAPGDISKPRSQWAEKNLSKPRRVQAPSSHRTKGSHLLGSARHQQAQTRGNAPCPSQRFVVMDVTRSDAGLLVKWDSLKGAVKYSLYLSDLDERLIDHFETPGQTSYLVTAGLGKETIYRLRLIATLEHGDKIVSESRNIKIAELSEHSLSLGNIGVRNKTAASVRCTEVKQ